jgi:hypothetical protein
MVVQWKSASAFHRVENRMHHSWKLMAEPNRAHRIQFRNTRRWLLNGQEGDARWDVLLGQHTDDIFQLFVVAFDDIVSLVVLPHVISLRAFIIEVRR